MDFGEEVLSDELCPVGVGVGAFENDYEGCVMLCDCWLVLGWGPGLGGLELGFELLAEAVFYGFGGVECVEEVVDAGVFLLGGSF